MGAMSFVKVAGAPAGAARVPGAGRTAARPRARAAPRATLRHDQRVKSRVMADSVSCNGRPWITAAVRSGSIAQGPAPPAYRSVKWPPRPARAGLLAPGGIVRHPHHPLAQVLAVEEPDEGPGGVLQAHHHVLPVAELSLAKPLGDVAE